MDRTKNNTQRRVQPARLNLVMETAADQVISIDLNNVEVNQGVDEENGAAQVNGHNRARPDDDDHQGDVSDNEKAEEVRQKDQDADDEDEGDVPAQGTMHAVIDNQSDSMNSVEISKNKKKNKKNKRKKKKKKKSGNDKEVAPLSESSSELGENDENGEVVDVNNPEASTSTAAAASKRKKRMGGFARAKKKKNQVTLSPIGCVKGEQHTVRYTLESLFHEQSHTKSIYGVAFNTVSAKWVRADAVTPQRNATNANQQAAMASLTDAFATCGDKVCTLYWYDKSTGKFAPHTTYRDESDVFYTCCFTWNLQNASQLLIVAGQRGLIRVIDLKLRMNIQTFHSHCLAVNDLKVPLWLDDSWCPNMLLSASNDHSIRLWNSKNGALVAKFGGEGGHEGGVLAVDFHPSERCFVSCGVDRSIRIWSFEREGVLDAIESSHEIQPGDAKAIRFKTVIEQVPVFVTRDIHEHMVDCVSWIKDWLVTRSCMEDISVFRPGPRLTTQIDEMKPHFKSTRYNSSDTSSGEDAWLEIKKKREAEGKPELGLGSVSNVAYDDLDPNYNWKLEFKLPPFYETARIHVDQTTCWFMRFGMDYRRQFMAQGDMGGNVLLRDLREEDPFDRKPIKISAHKETQGLVVRQVAFNFDGNYMVAVTDQCKVMVFNLAGSGVEKVVFRKVEKPAEPVSSVDSANNSESKVVILDNSNDSVETREDREFWLNRRNQEEENQRQPKVVAVSRYRDEDDMKEQSFVDVKFRPRHDREVIDPEKSSMGSVASTSSKSNSTSKPSIVPIASTSRSPIHRALGLSGSPKLPNSSINSTGRTSPKKLSNVVSEQFSSCEAQPTSRTTSTQANTRGSSTLQRSSQQGQGLQPKLTQTNTNTGAKHGKNKSPSK